MAGKTVPLSVRVSDDDAEFLAGLEISGATTPSEKLRAILTAERTRWERAQDPAEAAEFVRDLLRPAQRRVRRLEADAHKSSDAVLKLDERLPELTATAFAGPAGDADEVARHVRGPPSRPGVCPPTRNSGIGFAQPQSMLRSPGNRVSAEPGS